MSRDPEAFADMVVTTVKLALAPLQERLAVAEAKLAALPTVDKAVGDLRDRVVVVETKAAMPVAPDHSLSELVERVKAVESRPLPVVTDEGELRRRIEALESRIAPPPAVSAEDVAEVRGRILAVEIQTKSLETQVAAPSAVAGLVEKVERAVAELSKDVGALRERVAVVEVRPPVPGPQGEPGPPGRDGIDGKDGVAGLSFEGVYQDGQSYEKGHLVTWAGSSWHCNEPTSSRPGESKAWTLMVKRGRDGKDGKDLSPSMPVVTVGSRG